MKPKTCTLYKQTENPKGEKAEKRNFHNTEKSQSNFKNPEIIENRRGTFIIITVILLPI
jgi:hypothetical protein